MNKQDFVASTRSIEINSWRMSYFDKGPVDATPVLLLHGNPSWGFIWRDCIPPLLSAGLRVIVPDQIGFGLSEHPHSAAAHSLENHAANLVALIDKLGLKNIKYFLSSIISKFVTISSPILYLISIFEDPSQTFKGIIDRTININTFLINFYFSIKLSTFLTPNSVNGIIFIKKDRLLLGSKLPSR